MYVNKPVPEIHSRFGFSSVTSNEFVEMYTNVGKYNNDDLKAYKDFFISERKLVCRATDQIRTNRFNIEIKCT